MQGDPLRVEQTERFEQETEAFVGQRGVDAADEQDAGVGRQSERGAGTPRIFNRAEHVEVQRDREDLRRESTGDRALPGLAGRPFGRRQQDRAKFFPGLPAIGGLAR